MVIQVKIPDWLDSICTWPVLWYRRWRYGCAFRRIELGAGEFTIVDPEDYRRFGGFNWYVGGHGTKYYALRTVKNGENEITTVRLHREIMQPKDGMVVDHRNGDSLDNRRENMREATQGQNMYNRKKRRNSKSRFVGVWLDKNRGLWAAQIKDSGKKHFLGRFESEEEAARAYDAAAKKYRGEFARLNFPEGQNSKFSRSQLIRAVLFLLLASLSWFSGLEPFSLLWASTP